MYEPLRERVGTPPAQPSSPAPELATRRIEFHGRAVNAVPFRGRWAFRAAEAGLAIGYADGARLVDKVRGEWAEEFIEGKDYDLLRGQDLAEFRAVLDSPKSGESKTQQRGARALLVLYERGIDRALVLARTPLGRELRDLLVDHVLPSSARPAPRPSPARPPRRPRSTPRPSARSSPPSSPSSSGRSCR